MFNYYAVHKGWQRGIYQSFREVKDVTQEYENPVYKGFYDYNLAQKWLDQLEKENIIGSAFNKIYYYAYRNKNIKKLFYTKNECLQFQKKNGGEFKEFLFKDEAEQWLYQLEFKNKKNKFIQNDDTKFSIIISSDEEQIIISNNDIKLCNKKIKSLQEQIEIQIRKKVKLENQYKLLYNQKQESQSMNSSFIKNMQDFSI